MYDIITIGSATKDMFVKSSEFRVVRDSELFTGTGVCMSFGSKIELDHVYYRTGGGGTNTAVAFARLGFRTAFLGMVGSDLAGESVLRDLTREGVSTDLVHVDGEHTTGSSVIISPTTGGDRTIMVYRGANNHLDRARIEWDLLKCKWLYIAPLAGDSIRVIERLVKYALENGIKIALNPSSSYIKKGIPRGVLESVDVLFLNREEAALLTGVEFNRKQEIFQEVCNLDENLVVVTLGSEGAVICGKKTEYHQIPAEEVDVVVDTVGAGDAFGAGFIAGLVKTGSIEYAARVANANAASVIRKIGAKPGLLREFPEMGNIKMEGGVNW